MKSLPLWIPWVTNVDSNSARNQTPPPVRIRVGLSHSDVRTPLDAFCTRRHPQSTDAVQRLRDSVVVQRVASESIAVFCLIRADGGSELFVEGMPVDCETLQGLRLRRRRRECPQRILVRLSTSTRSYVNHEATYQRRRPNLAGWYCTSDSAIICWYRIEAEVRSPCSAN